MTALANKQRLCFGILFLHFTVWAASEFRPGEVWNDAGGQPIQAHGGGILVHSNVYYWYGEDRTPRGRDIVACYSSTNLCDWKGEGAVLTRDDLPRIDGFPTFMERPKVSGAPLGCTASLVDSGLVNPIVRAEPEQRRFD